MIRLRFVLVFILWIAAAGAEELVPAGVGRFVYTDEACNVGKRVPVHSWRPEIVAATTPILFVMHGTVRNADAYRDSWIPIAERRGLILLAPEFDVRQYPAPYGYHLGGVFASFAKANPREEWSFSMIERIFDHVKRETGNTSETYMIYGHSAGGQFVHRFVLFMPRARYSVALPANSGWYTFPDPDIMFPQGMGMIPDATGLVRSALQRHVIVLAGTADNDPNHAQLRTGPLVDFQGPHRFARARNFFEAGREEAKQLGVPFGWKFVEVPGVAHSNRGMSRGAEKALFE